MRPSLEPVRTLVDRPKPSPRLHTVASLDWAGRCMDTKPSILLQDSSVRGGIFESAQSQNMIKLPVRAYHLTRLALI